MADTFTGSIQTHKQNKKQIFVYTQPAEDARKHTGFNAARSAHVPDNYPSASPMVPMRLSHSSSKATVSPAELFARPASTREVNRAPDHALSRVTMHPPAEAAPRLERAAEKALFRLENDVGAHRELGWTHACRHSRLNSHCDGRNSELRSRDTRGRERPGLDFPCDFRRGPCLVL